jgi:two-component system, LytTR family, response regulator
MEKKLSALIVDDEEKALELLQKLLEDTQQFSEIKCASSADSASNELMAFNPDLIFLDIKMPGQDGFSFLKELKQENKQTEVIFVTAYDQYALQAIKNHAFDYLLKPVDRKELFDCIMQYKQRKQGPYLLDRLEKFILENKESTRMRINTRNGYIFIDPNSILYCQADGNYTMIDLGGRQQLCSMQLGVVEVTLPKNNFIRLGRSLIVNGHYISKVDRKSNQITFEKSGANYSLKISKAQLKELEDKLEE